MILFTCNNSLEGVFTYEEYDQYHKRPNKTLNSWQSKNVGVSALSEQSGVGLRA